MVENKSFRGEKLRLKDKVAIVTGASQGIGQGSDKQFRNVVEAYEGVRFC